MAKRIYNSWKQEDMEEALLKLCNGEIGFNKAHRKYNIPKPTLRRHFKGLNKNTKFGRPTDLNEEMEKCTTTSSIEITGSPNKQTIENTVFKNKGTPKRNLEKTETQIKRSQRSWYCNVCKEDRQENMIQCLKCKGWVHDLCAGVDKKMKKCLCDHCCN